MALPRIVVRGKELILLSGFKDEAKETDESVCGVVVDDEIKLQQAAKRNPDAVAFGYEWRANGWPLLKPPLRCHVTSRERGPLVSDKTLLATAAQAQDRQ